MPVRIAPALHLKWANFHLKWQGKKKRGTAGIKRAYIHSSNFHLIYYHTQAHSQLFFFCYRAYSTKQSGEHPHLYNYSCIKKRVHSAHYHLSISSINCICCCRHHVRSTLYGTRSHLGMKRRSLIDGSATSGTQASVDIQGGVWCMANRAIVMNTPDRLA